MRPMLASLSLLIACAFPAVAADAAPAAAKPYPLTVCIVSGEPLGGMGKPVVVVRDGQEVKFCCRGCIKDFDKDPAKFLSKITAADKSAADKPAAPAHQH